MIESTRIAHSLPLSFDLASFFITAVAVAMRPCVWSTSSVSSSSAAPCACARVRYARRKDNMPAGRPADRRHDGPLDLRAQLIADRAPHR